MGDTSPASLASLDKKYGVALALYAVLAVLVWFTIGEGTVAAFGRQIEIRWFPVFILATFAFRTWVAMQADRIRRGSSK
jgi:hypothetical protein